jgi:pyridoxal phosphate enzyme (YggS family)
VTTITENLAALRERIARAARLADRDPQSVTIVAVSKTQPPAAIGAACRAGLSDFAESYVQEALPKVTELGQGLTWHFIGTVQANKTKALAGNFQWVQTVASPRAAERLSRQRPFYAAPLQICIQVRPEAAGARSGAAGAAVPALAAAIAGLPRLALRGLMFMPLPDLTAPALRAEFGRVRQLFDELRAAGFSLDTLSMGMSADLEAAIAEGSTMVRIGTALFGERPRQWGDQDE